MKRFDQPAETTTGLAPTDQVRSTGLHAKAGHFPETQWTALLKPLSTRLPNESETLDRLFRIYRPAIVAFIRARIRNPEEAEDLAHDYIHRLLRSQELSSMDPAKGRFRGFLVVSIKHFIYNHYAASCALKRGGGAVHVPIEEHLDQLAEDPNDQDLFLAEWVAALHAEVVRCLRAEWEKAGKGGEFHDYEPFLLDKYGNGSRDGLAAKHRLTVNAVNVRISRLRDRYKLLLREVVSQTVRENEVDEEIRDLTRRILADSRFGRPESKP
jgi:DNA-directed RNA polymerase specialized sigma24 family protein